MKQEYLRRILRLFIGLTLAALSSVLSLQSFLGSTPWNVFHQGIFLHTGVAIGTVTQLVGLVIVFVDWRMGEPIGVGTLCNMIYFGFMVNVFMATGIFVDPTTLWMKFAYLGASLIINPFSIYLYMSARLGSGPRDSLMVGLTKRLKLPIGWVRNIIDICALLLGFLMGGLVGVGTLAVALLTGPSIQVLFKLFHYNPATNKSESIQDTVARIKAGV